MDCLRRQVRGVAGLDDTGSFGGVVPSHLVQPVRSFCHHLTGVHQQLGIVVRVRSRCAHVELSSDAYDQRVPGT